MLLGCAVDYGGGSGSGNNPFLSGSGGGKDDSGYVNLEGREAHVTIEAEIDAPAHQILNGPAELAQFAVTYLRKREDFYLELLAEDTTAPDRVEWMVNGQWTPTPELGDTDRSTLRRFRMPGVNAVLLNEQVSRTEAGRVFEVPVPYKPFSIFRDAGDSCADYNSHIDLSQSVYWYLWNPTGSDCEMELQTMTITVDELLPHNPESYPEYDRLWEDGELSVVLLFARLDHDAIEDDYNWDTLRSFVRFLTEAGFTEEPDAPLGQRFVRDNGQLRAVIDVYGPDLFHSVADSTRLHNWQRAVSEHEVVMYNGHSVLGSGMAFEQVEYPDFYQIFSVGSCLSYEYYVRPVLEGKGGWENVDVISNVHPTYYTEMLPLVSTLLARLLDGYENGGQQSWQDIMSAVSAKLRHSRFGVSGARDNCFSPTGDRCDGTPSTTDGERFSNTEAAAIPDNDPDGLTSQLIIDDRSQIGNLTLELDITHSYVGDLEVLLSHDGYTEQIFQRSGGSNDDIRGAFEVRGFDGSGAQGAWTLQVIDHARADTGTLNGWALVLSP